MIGTSLSPLPEFGRLLDLVGGETTTMPVDAYRKDSVLTLLFDLPGVDPEDVDVTVESGVLTVAADRTEEETPGVDWLIHERHTDTYSRRIFLSEDLDPDQVAAHYERGVLQVTIPVKETARPRRIEVGRSPKRIESGTAA